MLKEKKKLNEKQPGAALSLSLSECSEKPKLNFAWQNSFSFAKMLSNELLRNFQINGEPSLG